MSNEESPEIKKKTQLVTLVESLELRLSTLEGKNEETSQNPSQLDLPQTRAKPQHRTMAAQLQVQNHAICINLDLDLVPKYRSNIQKDFKAIKDRLYKISLPAHVKVNDSAVGIKQDSKPALKIIIKTARLAATVFDLTT